MNEDKIVLEGILEQGYGLSPKKVMKDRNLTIEAKAIYAYMSSFAGNGTSAFPSMSLMEEDLGISEARLRKHRDLLIKAGYIEVHREKPEGGKFGRNVYTIKQVITQPYPQNTSMVKSTDGKHHDGETPTWQIVGTNNNTSFNNNSISNNNSFEEEEAKVPVPKFNLFEEYRKITGKTPNAIQSQHLIKWVSTFPSEVLQEGLNRLQERGPDNPFSYLKSIMEDWKEKKLLTLEVILQQDGKPKGGHKNAITQSNDVLPDDHEQRALQEKLARIEKLRGN